MSLAPPFRADHVASLLRPAPVVDIDFMVYHTGRAGALDPLRLMPKGAKRVLLGFVTTGKARSTTWSG